MKMSYYPQNVWNVKKEKKKNCLRSLICNDTPKPKCMAAAKRNEKNKQTAFEFHSWKYKLNQIILRLVGRYVEKTRPSRLSNIHLINKWRHLPVSLHSAVLCTVKIFELWSSIDLNHEGYVFREQLSFMLRGQTVRTVKFALKQSSFQRPDQLWIDRF